MAFSLGMKQLELFTEGPTEKVYEPTGLVQETLQPGNRIFDWPLFIDVAPLK
jgi:hypothetical protein